MKKIVLSFIMMIVAMAASAQQIAVVTAGGSTTMYQTLGDAIDGAPKNSVIYLPAGGFQISDDVKITKKLTIIGVTHKANSDNAEGNTIVSGNLFFNEGSDNSAVMGCYISGTVYVGNDKNAVNGILVKYCNVGYINVYNNQCAGTKINQCYVRNYSSFGGAEGTITNSIMPWLRSVTGGEISNNIFTGHYSSSVTLYEVNNVTISNNIFLLWCGISGSNFQYSNNLSRNGSWGNDEYGVSLNLNNWDGVFKKNNGVTPASDYHFTAEYAEYEGQVGIYCTKNGSTGFSDGCLPPVPYVSSKRIDEQTDAEGNLTIRLRVRAGE